MSLVDPTGFVLTTIRDDATVAAITARVRGGEPMGKTFNSAGVETDAGDSRGAGKYIPFIVITGLGHARLKRAPIQEVRLVAKCYGVTYQGAETMAGAVSDAIHAAGHRINSSGVSIFGTFDDGGEAATKDPDTGQPMAAVVIQVNCSTALIT